MSYFWPTTLRAYYYYNNGWGDDEQHNWFRAENVEKMIQKYSSEFNIRPDLIYLWEERFNYHNIYCVDCDSTDCCHFVNDKVKSFYDSLAQCSKHPNHKATFWFYYGLPKNVIPGLDALCDDCLVDLVNTDLEEEYGDLLREIYPNNNSPREMYPIKLDILTQREEEEKERARRDKFLNSLLIEINDSPDQNEELDGYNFSRTIMEKSY